MEYNLMKMLESLESTGKKSKHPALTSFLSNFLNKNPNVLDINYDTKQRLGQVQFPQSYTFQQINAPNPKNTKSLMDAGIGNTINVLDLVQQGDLLKDLLIKQYENANILGPELKGMQTKDVNKTLINLDKMTKMINSAIFETQEDIKKRNQERYIKGEIEDF